MLMAPQVLLLLMTHLPPTAEDVIPSTNALGDIESTIVVDVDDSHAPMALGGRIRLKERSSDM